MNSNACPACGKQMIGKRNHKGELIGFCCPDVKCGTASIGVAAVEEYVTSRRLCKGRKFVASSNDY